MEYEYRIGRKYTFKRYKIQYSQQVIYSIAYCEFEDDTSLGILYHPTTAEITLDDLKLYDKEFNGGKRFPRKLKIMLLRKAVADKI